MTPTRIYMVTDAEGGSKHLVRAASAAQAVAHVSRRFTAQVASQDDLVEIVVSGVKVETYAPARSDDQT